MAEGLKKANGRIPTSGTVYLITNYHVIAPEKRKGRWVEPETLLVHYLHPTDKEKRVGHSHRLFDEREGHIFLRTMLAKLT